MEILIEVYEVNHKQGAWLAMVPSLPVTYGYGDTPEEAMRLALAYAHGFLMIKLKKGNLSFKEGLALTFRQARPEEQKGAFAPVDWPSTVGWKGEKVEKEAAE